MDASAVRAIVNKRIERAMREIGIPHWRINVEYGPTGTPHWAASCDRQGRDYWHATITLDPTKLDDEEHVLTCLYHELAHVLLAPLDVYRDAITVHINTDAAHTQEAILWTHAIEACITTIERGLLRPLSTPSTKHAETKPEASTSERSWKRG